MDYKENTSSEIDFEDKYWFTEVSAETLLKTRQKVAHRAMHLQGFQAKALRLSDQLEQITAAGDPAYHLQDQVAAMFKLLEKREYDLLVLLRKLNSIREAAKVQGTYTFNTLSKRCLKDISTDLREMYDAWRDRRGKICTNLTAIDERKAAMEAVAALSMAPMESTTSDDGYDADIPEFDEAYE